MIALLRLAGQNGNEAAADFVRLVDSFIAGEVSSKDFGDQLDATARKNPDWSEAIAELRTLTGEYRIAAQAVGILGAELQQLEFPALPGPVNPRGAVGASRRARNEKVELGQAWLSEQERRNSLTREQRDLEDEIARIRKDTPEGAIISDAQIEALAKANLTWKGGNKRAGGSGSKSDPFGDATKDMQRRINEIVEMTAAQADLNPLINDYGYAVERLRAQQELENAATKAGIALGDPRRQQIAGLADAYATATAEAQRLAEEQNASVAKFEELKDAARSALETIVDGFIEGKSAGDIFADVLKNIGSQLLQMGFNSLFGGGSTPGNGLFGNMFGFADGGYTGPGRRNQPAGVVHKGEVVWSQNDVARSGGVAAVEALRRGLTVPSLPVMRQTEAGPSITFAPQIDARGADQAAVARLERVLAKQAAEFEGRVKQIVARRSKDMW